MKKINKKNIKPLVLLSGFLLSTGAGAAQLGKLEVVSSANEPFLAKIQIQSLRPEERKGLQAKLASGEAFKAARLEMDPRLSGLKFEIKTGTSADAAVIQISSDKPLGKGFLDALVELSWSGGRVSREYTFTPAEEKAPTSKPESPEVRPPQVNVLPAPKKESEKPSSPVADSPTEDSSAFQYLKPSGRKGEQSVQKGQTLSGIASKLAKENGVSLNQAMATVYEANREAFSGNSVHRLKAGANLVIPNQVAFQARTEKEALVVLARNDDRNVYSRYAQQLGLLTSIEPALAAPSSATQSQGKVESGAQIVPAPSRGDQLKIAPSGSASAKADAAAEELTAKTKALGEANERIALLEKNVSDLQKLLEMQKDVAEPVKPAAASDEVAAAPEEPKSAAEDASSNKPEVQNETLSKAEDQKKEELPASENEEKKESEDTAGLLPWLLGGAGAALLSVIGLLVWRSRAKRKSEEPIVPQEPSFERVIPEDQLVPVVSSEVFSNKPADSSLAVASNDAFDLESLLDAQSEQPHAPVELDVRPVQPEPEADIEKVELVEADVLQETSVQNVDLEFPDEPEAPVENNSILDDLDMLSKGAESAQAELQAMRETPKEAEPEEVDESSESEADADLDLDVPEPAKEPIDEAVWQEVATKLDLAGAYVEIGDADGAKELLNEILKKGDAEQIEKAKALLETLS